MDRTEALDHVILCGQKLKNTTPEEILREDKELHSNNFHWEQFDIARAQALAHDYNQKNKPTSSVDRRQTGVTQMRQYRIIKGEMSPY